jgi:hypothetical protein
VQKNTATRKERPSTAKPPQKTDTDFDYYSVVPQFLFGIADCGLRICPINKTLVNSNQFHHRKSAIRNPKSAIKRLDHVRPYKTADSVRYVLRPSRFPLTLRISRPLVWYIPSSSAQTGKPAAKTATPPPYKHPADQEREISSIELYCHISHRGHRELLKTILTTKFVTST